jgi:prepilin-type processing-associated H-X9-DG protein
MLTALLLPAVQSVRATAKTNQCSVYMRELALAAINYETAKGHWPGYVQRVKRGNGAYATAGFDTATSTVFVRDAREGEVPVQMSWATALLSRIERQDVWDQIVATDSTVQPPIRQVSLFICPADDEAFTVLHGRALSFVVNTGAWDFDESDDGGEFMKPPGRGDTPNNGVFMNLVTGNVKSNQNSIRDGAATTLLLSENIHRTYEWPTPGQPPHFSWLSGDFDGMTYPGKAEQHFGMIWVVSASPQPGGLQPEHWEQERINGNSRDEVQFRAFYPNWARPASNHSGGVNVAFADGHTQFMRDTIEYLVYQQLLTSHGAKCVEPLDHNRGIKPPDLNHPIQVFRRAQPLSEGDY